MLYQRKSWQRNYASGRKDLSLQSRVFGRLNEENIMTQAKKCVAYVKYVRILKTFTGSSSR